MEAHRSYERFEQGHLVAGGDGDAGAHHGRTAAMVVAVMAAFLALATFLANEAVKEVITGETHRAETSGQLESNRLKIDVVSGNSELLRAIGTGTLRLGPAATAARWHEARVARELKPADARLVERIQAHEREADHANSQHVDYALAEVGLEVGIVLASVSIISRRRWLLGAGGLAASAGVALLLIGLVFV